MFRQQASASLIEDYCRSLSDLSADDVEAAGESAMKSERFLPTPSVLREHARLVKKRATEDSDRQLRIAARSSANAPTHETLYERTEAALKEGHKFDCPICHDGGYVLIESKRLPGGGDPHDNHSPGMKGIRFPQGMAYFSLIHRGYVTLHCHCGQVKPAHHPRRVQAGYKDIGLHADEVCSYYDKWAEEYACQTKGER